ncbi:MAG: hypothetical protein ACLFRR_05470 [Spirochaetaceae bacterium]
MQHINDAETAPTVLADAPVPIHGSTFAGEQERCAHSKEETNATAVATPRAEQFFILTTFLRFRRG